MIESDLWDLLPDERPLPDAARRAIKEALMAQTRQDPRPADDEPGDLAAIDLGPVRPRRQQRRRPGRIRLAAVAAVAIVVAGVVGAVALADRTGPTTAGPRADEPEMPAAQVEEALAATSAALASSGQIECAYDHQRDGEPLLNGVETFRFSGDDRSHEQTSDLEDFDRETRFVGGNAYSYIPVGQDPTPRWYHWTEFTPGTEIDPDLWGEIVADPSSLLDELALAGPFDAVGTDDLDGVPTHRFRATSPDHVGIGICGATSPDRTNLRALDLWVDADGYVRRVEGSWDKSATPAGADPGAGGTSGTVTLTFTDLDQPVTIEAPPDAIDTRLTDVGLAVR